MHPLTAKSIWNSLKVMRESKSGEKLVCKLQKSLYGLKQSGRNWNTMLNVYLTENGFKQNPADNCLYTREKQNKKVMWVDDLIIAANTEEVVKSVKIMLTEIFKMKDLGKLNNFLGIDFKQSDGQVTMTQKRYINKILSRFGMQDCKPRETPCESKFEYTNGAKKLVEPRLYREAVGSLIY